jgi:hypothetical protein
MLAMVTNGGLSNSPRAELSGFGCALCSEKKTFLPK